MRGAGPATKIVVTAFVRSFQDVSRKNQKIRWKILEDKKRTENLLKKGVVAEKRKY